MKIISSEQFTKNQTRLKTKIKKFKEDINEKNTNPLTFVIVINRSKTCLLISLRNGAGSVGKSPKLRRRIRLFILPS